MATLVKTAQGRWKSVIRRRGWPTVAKTFRIKRDAQDWGRAAEDEMVRGVFVNRASSHRLSVKLALARYMAEVTPTKRITTQHREAGRIKMLVTRLGEYSLVTLTPELVSAFRDTRLGEGKSPNTVRLELAVLSHLFTIARRGMAPSVSLTILSRWYASRRLCTGSDALPRRRQRSCWRSAIDTRTRCLAGSCGSPCIPGCDWEKSCRFA